MTPQSEKPAPQDFQNWAESILSANPGKQRAASDNERELYLRAAAVLVDFPAESLTVKPGESPRTDAASVLARDSFTVPGRGDRRALKTSARLEALRGMGTAAERQQIRALNPQTPISLVQRVFDEFMAGDYKAAYSLDPAELNAAGQVTPWVKAFPDVRAGDLRTEQQLARDFAYRQLLGRIEKLCDGFVGRVSELATLRSFVGVVQSQSFGESASRAATRFLGPDAKPPLFIQGMGGIGKSSLVAEFIRQHAHSTRAFPWVYLDFDDPSLNVADIRSIVVECVEQLSAQYSYGSWELVRDLADEFATVQQASDSNSADLEQTIDYGDIAQQEVLLRPVLKRLVATFADSVRHAVGATSIEKMSSQDDLPWLIVLDTFEEVQKGGIERGELLWSFLSDLQDRFPRLRLVFAGRAAPTELRLGTRVPTVLQLTEFDEPVAIMFLQKQGVPSIDVARALFRQVGGLPLTLGLAARVSRDESSNAGQIAGLTTRSFLLFSASEAAVQGQLYDRILLRIRDEDVRAIAHPGLVVRRITTDVIRGVLAVPCGLGEISLERAQALYDGLRRQAGLISSGSDGALRHQPDIREAMLKLIARDRPAQVQAIHEAALAFYEHRDDPVSKAEWVFHALKLGVTRELIDRRWTPQVADSIVGSFDELPPRGQVYVSLKTGRPLSAELRKVADTEEWEIEIERKAREALRQGSIDKAAKLVSERTDRSPASGLYAVDAIVAMRQKDFERADAVLARGIDGTRLAGLTDRLIELLRLQGESWASRGRQEEAAAALLEAQDLASRTGLPSLALQVLADRVRGDRKPGVAEVEDVVRATPDSDFASLQVHLRGLFQAYGTASDLLLRKGLGAFVVNRDVVLDAAPALATQIEWDQNTRVNRRLLDRLASHGDDPGLRLELSRVLESALDPRRAQRAR